MNQDYFIDDNDQNNWVTLPRPLSSYTKEELAMTLINNKKETNQEQTVRIAGTIGAELKTNDCNTPEEFLEKYSAILDRAGFKGASINQNVTPIKKEEVRIITIPLGMMNYTQEDLAHLVMDNKRDDEELGVRVANGVVLDSVGCNTVEDFIKKNADSANRLGIKPGFEDKLAAVGNIMEMPSNLNQFQMDTNKIEAARAENVVDPDIEEEKTTVEEKPQINMDVEMDLVPLLQQMIASKQSNNQDVTVNYKGNSISTENCNNMVEIAAKYNALIQKNNKQEITKILKNREIEKATFLFQIPRGNYYNATNEVEEAKLETIKAKNSEYVRFVTNSGQLDFSNPEVAYNWLNEIVPYINTHALNLNLGLNFSLESADKYILSFMESKGYNADLSNPNNFETVEKYQITKRLNELKEYHFFLSDYSELPKEDIELTSAKTEAMTEISYLEAKVAKGYKGISLLNKKLMKLEAEGKIHNQLESSKLDMQIKLLEDTIYAKSDNSFLHNGANDQEKQADKAVVIAVLSNELGDIENARSLVDGLPDTSPLKQELYEQLYENNPNGLGDNPDIAERRALYAQKKDYEKAPSSEIEDIKNKIKYIDEAIKYINPKIAELRSKYQLEDYGKENVTKEPEVEVEKETPVVDHSEETASSTLDTSDDQFDASPVDSEDTIKEFTPIKSFKKISKNLYEKLNSAKVKEIITKAVNMLKEKKKAALKYLGFASAIAISAAAIGSMGGEEVTIDNSIVAEASVDDVKEDNAISGISNDSTVSVTEEETYASNPSDVKVASVNAMEPEYTVSLDDASSIALNNVINGTGTIYSSAEDAYHEENGKDPYMDAWKEANNQNNNNNNNWYVEQDGVMSQITKDQADDYFQNGENIVQKVENNGTVIGYVNVENSNSERAKR